MLTVKLVEHSFSGMMITVAVIGIKCKEVTALPQKTNLSRGRAVRLALSLLTSVMLASCGSGSSPSSSSSGGGPGTGPSTDPSIVMLNQQANDLVWDPVNQVIYLSIPSGAASNPNTISVLNPLSGKITKSVSIGPDPNVLALSAGSQYLYVGVDGSSSVQRLILPNLTPDVSYSLGADNVFGPYVALDLQAAPVNPHTTAVLSGFTNTSALGGISIYDDATPRATHATPAGYSIQWGSDDTALYAAGFDLYTLSVNSGGVTQTNDYPNVFAHSDGWAWNIHYAAGTHLICNDNGQVVDPNTGQQVGSFTASPTSQQGVMVPDTVLNAAFFVYQTTTVYQLAIESFDLTNPTSIDQVFISGVFGTPLRLIRWGKNGLAFNTTSISGRDQIFIISGSIVTKSSNASSNSGRVLSQPH